MGEKKGGGFREQEKGRQADSTVQGERGSSCYESSRSAFLSPPEGRSKDETSILSLSEARGKGGDGRKDGGESRRVRSRRDRNSEVIQESRLSHQRVPRNEMNKKKRKAKRYAKGFKRTNEK